MIKHIMALVAVCCLSMPAVAAPDLSASLAGAWTGTLQYRDYSSDRQVTLPTTVTFSGPAAALRGDYVYDDGPNKTVRSSEHWSLAPDGSTLALAADGAPARVTVYRAGAGNDITLEAEGAGVENDQAVAVRTVLERRADALTITRLTQLPDQPWRVRHVYTLRLQSSVLR
jgi:hypothetical protein